MDAAFASKSTPKGGMGMKKLIAALLAVVLLCAAGSALASDNVKFKSSAYVYSCAGSDRTGVLIRKGSVAQYVGQDGMWAQIKYGKSVGWVRTSCLKATGDDVKVVYSTDIPAQNPEAAPDATAGIVKTLRQIWRRTVR